MHDTSRPDRPSTNGVAERAVRRVSEGASCALLQSGFSGSWWREAMSTFCFLSKCIDVQISTGMTAYEARFNISFSGPVIPFGAHIQFKPSSDADKARLPKIGSGKLHGVFLGCHQRSGGVGRGMFMWLSGIK